MAEIVAHKKIVISAEDRVTSVIAKTNQAFNQLEQHLSQLGMKFNSGASEQSSYKTALNSTKSTVNETDEAIRKLDHNIDKLSGTRTVSVHADTTTAQTRIDKFSKNVDALKNNSPIIKPHADTSEANEKLHGLQRTTESVGHSFTRLRTIIAGTAIGGAISTGFISAFNGIKNGIKGAMGAGIQFNMTMQKMNATWDTLTGSASKAKSMSNSIVDLSNKLGWSVDVTNELAQQFYHVFDNQPETMKLTKSFLTMGDAIGLSDDRLQQVAMDFTHMLSSSKLQLGDLNQITDAFPMFGNALLDYERKVQHNSHLTMSELRNDISAGKIDAKDAETVFNQLGDHYKKASENLMGTLPGMFRQISSKWKELMGDMMAPTTNAANPVVKQISKWISSEGTTKKFERLGRAVNQGFGAIMKSLANTFGSGSVAKMLDNVVNSLTRFVQAASKWTANNAESIVKTIKSIGSIAGSVGKGAFDAIGDFLNILGHTSGHGLKGIADALESISKHKVALEMIGRALATYFVYSKLSKAAKGLSDIYSAVKGIAGTSATKIKDVMSALNGDYDGSGKLLNMLSDHQASKPVGPTGVLKQEAAKDGEKAGGNFLKSFMLKAKGLGRGIAGLFLPSSFLNVGSKIGSKMATGLSKAFKPAVIAIKKSGSALKDISAVISEKGFALKGKIAGSRFASAFVRTGGAIKGFATKYIIPETWLTAGRKAGTLFRSGFSTASSKLGDSFIGRFASKLGGSRLFSVGKGLGGKLVSGLNIAIGAVDILRALTGSHIHNRAKMAGKGIGTILGGAIGTVLGGPIGGAIGGMLGGAIGGKAGPALSKMFKGSIDFFKELLKGDWSGAFGGIAKGFQKMWKGVTNWAKDTWKKAKDWWNNDDESSSSSSSHKSKQPSEKEIKSLGGNHYSRTDIANIKQMNSAVRTYTQSLKKLKAVVKKDDPTKQLRNMSKEFRRINPSLKESAKYWKGLAKPLEASAKAFKIVDKALSAFKRKNNPMDRLNSSVQKLTKTVKKEQFGKLLAKQMQIADKSMSGKHSFVGQFESMTKRVISQLRRFRRSFDSDWRSTWTRLDSYPSRGLSRTASIVSSRLNAVLNREHSFSHSFLSSWRSWANDVVSAMRSGFEKLPGIAQHAMSGIVSRLNSGISAINAVISDFGGDQRLGTIHYARGTFFHPGGKAVLNDGPTAHKQELVWEPSRGFSLPQGQNTVHDLERGAMVLDAPHTDPLLNRMGIPHYAGGTLSEDEQDQLAEEFIDNPIKASRDLVLKVTNWDSSVPVIADLGKATAIGFSRGIANVLKDLLGIIKEPINGDWTPVIKSAARLLHFHIAGWQIAKLLRQIQTESGGREVVTNHWDSNAAAGHPSQGLLQFVPSTFNTWAVGKYRNINRGFDQILAAINALNHGGEGGWGNIGNGHGWATGGEITSQQFGWVGDNAQHHEFVINPYNSNSLPLLTKAWTVMNANHPEWRTSTGSSYNAEMIALMKAAVASINNIDIHPRVYVDDVRRPINNLNAMDYSRVMN